MKFLIINTLILAMALQAQAKPKAYIDHEDSLFGGQSMYVDGKEVEFGFLGFQDIPKAMESNPKAAELARAHVAYRNWGFGLTMAGLVGALAYSLNTDSTGNNRFDSGTYLAILAVGVIPGTILQARSITKLVRAINEYNGVYAMEQEASLELTPATNGFGLALRF